MKINLTIEVERKRSSLCYQSSYGGDSLKGFTATELMAQSQPQKPVLPMTVLIDAKSAAIRIFDQLIETEKAAESVTEVPN